MHFIEKLNKVVASLREHPEIYVAHYKVLDANPDDIEVVEKALGYALDEDIRDFYRHCGGVQLLWLYKSNEAFDQKKTYIEEELAKSPLFDFGMFYGGLGMLSDGSSWDELHCDGVIMIAPMKMTFLDQSFNDNSDSYIDPDMFESYGIFEDTEALKIRKFEQFSLAVNIAFILDGSPSPLLLTAYDNSEYGESAVISFPNYLELLLKSKGSITRGHGFLISSDFEHERIELEDIEAFELEES